MVRMRRWVLLFLVLLVVILVGLNVVSLGVRETPFGAVCLCGWGRSAFDAVTWRAADGDVGTLGSRGPVWDNRRAGMVEDVMRHRLRKGMARNEVAALLGEESSGGGGMGDYESCYPLLAFPRMDQRLAARVVFGVWSPYLKLEYRGDRLVRWGVR